MPSIPASPASVDDATRVRQNPRTACRVYDGLAEVITLDDPIRQHRLSLVATRIWQHLENPATVAEVALRVVAEFEVDVATARADTRSFCEDMLARGMILVDG